MDNVKKFEDFLDRMQGLLDNAKKQGHIIVRIEDLENAFPELKESEDERIRKDIISYIQLANQFIPQFQKDKWLSWLEKQGEQAKIEALRTEYEKGRADAIAELKQKPFDYSNATIQQKDFAEIKQCGQNDSECDIIETIKKKVIDHFDNHLELDNCFSIGGLKNDILRILNEAKPAEEYNITGIGSKNAQGKLGEMIKNLKHDNEVLEQKPTEKVEPKFKVGDWVVWDNKISCHIDNIYQGKESLMYTITDTNNMTRSYSVKGFDNNAHLWTIKDTKDGDMLVTKLREKPFIFKGLLDEFHPKSPVAYCGLDFKNNFITAGGVSWWTAEEVEPATKEQRDTLMKAMADAGYTFDFDKKELKKIEPTDKYEGLTDFERTLADICVGWIGEELGWKQYIKDNADVLLKIAIKKFNSVQDAHFEQKPAWSEEDEAHINGIIDYLLDYKLLVYEEGMNVANGVQEELDWLKSLKPQSQWKPSDEQIRYLQAVVNEPKNAGAESCHNALAKLLGQLKNIVI